ncbi:MAG: YgiQ family radical SAM protein [Desulfobacterales bacterium]|nr:YgiQ family radical SAM protein [Desulfobacteraceae bacterium]MBT7696502.1 YgiQ family radical SAM protein [Desulfobacterales bacterium]
MFIPTTKKELNAIGWESLDVILVTGDTYVDSPYIGVAVIGKVLIDAGYKVGIIAQPDISSENDIGRLGEPNLFWGITSGCMDSMVSNYTATNKYRNKDDLTGGGQNNRRPDMAVIAYTNLVRRYFKKTKPIVIGGIEASLRRISHYHYKSNSIRRSILFDAKADIIVYGMGEKPILELAENFSNNRPVNDVRGICYISAEKKEGYRELPSHTEVAADRSRFTEMFKIFYENNDPVTGKGLCQKQDTRYLIQNPPQIPLTSDELDHIHELDYERDVHPYYASWGPVRALETIRFSIITHRGCYGDCNFCAISVHQGRRITDRSESSIMKEASVLTKHTEFKGYIQDVGGPSANMYGIECKRKETKGACRDKGCLTPIACDKLEISHLPQINLLKKIRRIPKVKKVFIGSGIRYDLVLKDKTYGMKYLEEVIRHHISGQLKVAPEHSEDHILTLMGKPPIENFLEFFHSFEKINRRVGKKQFLTCYFIAAYPGCTLKDMERLNRFSRRVLKFKPRQIQVFTPSPSTPATLMYYTEKAYDNGKPLFVAKDKRDKEKQKALILKGSSK